MLLMSKSIFHMALIEIVDLSSYKMVDLSIAMLVITRPGIFPQAPWTNSMDPGSSYEILHGSILNVRWLYHVWLVVQ